MDILGFLFNLTDHQLKVLATLGALIGGLGGLLGGVSAVFARLGWKWARQAANNTTTKQWADGELHTTTVAELTHQAVHNTEEFRGELTHLVNDPPLHGRRRLPTTDIQITPESRYE